uniref:Glycolipid transfer protein domain containing 2 n=1 Tax=Nothobranchius kuhntae TaxID=321403 RepID=A0A1A8K2K7_NOTKU
MPLVKDCPGQLFQARRLLQYLRSSLDDDGDILLEPYLLSWDQLLNFMESLGTMVGFFSQKVREKITLIRELSLKHGAKAHGKSADAPQRPTPAAFEPSNQAYRSVRSMVEAELKAGVVNFSYRTDSGCRTLLRLHRSLLWLKLMLEGLSEGADGEGRLKTPGELSRDKGPRWRLELVFSACEPERLVNFGRRWRRGVKPDEDEILTFRDRHKPLERRYTTCRFGDVAGNCHAAASLKDSIDYNGILFEAAAEIVFLALPERDYFLKLVCVQTQQEATPILRIIIQALTLVHTQTQRILAEHELLELP